MAAKDGKILKDFGNKLIEKCGVEKIAIVGAGSAATCLLSFVFLMVLIPNNFLDNKEEL